MIAHRLAIDSVEVAPLVAAALPHLQAIYMRVGGEEASRFIAGLSKHKRARGNAHLARGPQTQNLIEESTDGVGEVGRTLNDNQGLDRDRSVAFSSHPILRAAETYVEKAGISREGNFYPNSFGNWVMLGGFGADLHMSGHDLIPTDPVRSPYAHSHHPSPIQRMRPRSLT